MLLLFFAQDIAHIDGGYSSVDFNVLTYFLLAGFEVTIIGRFLGDTPRLNYKTGRIPRKYESYLAQRWAEGFRTARHLLAEIRKLGYAGSLTHLERLLSEWRRARRGPSLQALSFDEGGGGASLALLKVPPIPASYLCMKPRGMMTEEQIKKVAQLKQKVPVFAAMRQLALRFRGILQGRDPAKLDSWLDDAHRSGLYGLRRFAYTIRHDLAAVRNAISERWSNGQTEGHINRLKTLKRQMYGRAGTELLRARLLPLLYNEQPTK